MHLFYFILSFPVCALSNTSTYSEFSASKLVKVAIAKYHGLLPVPSWGAQQVTTAARG
jgi:hypothetical protein